MRLDCIGGMYCLDMDVAGVSWDVLDARRDAKGIAQEALGLLELRRVGTQGYISIDALTCRFESCQFRF